MPYIVPGEPTEAGRSYRDAKFDYDYPNGLNLKPGSDFHEKLKNKIWQRARESRCEISKRFPSWRNIDKTLTAYIPLKDKEEQLKQKDSTKPVSIVFPYTYSMLEALLTYMSMAFFQDPMFQYEGVEDSDTVGAAMLENVIRLHCIKNKVALNFHTVLRDSLSYGVGIAVPTWVRKHGRKAIRTKVSTESDLGASTQLGVEFIDDLLFEGNALDNIDPYMWLPDPSVSSSETQKGEFFGWVERDNIMNMLTEEAEVDSDLFNVKYAKLCQNKRSALSLDQSERGTKFGMDPDQHRKLTGITNPVDNIKMYINLIPKDWNLSDSELPEKWFFQLTADNVITSAYKADHNHGMYPAAVASPEFDGYSITPIGRLEVLYGLQHTLDFLFNNHVANLRKAVNDMLVVDPYLINVNDLKDPEPGKIIRLRRPAWGRGVDKVVQQLQVNDITRANISDSAYITQWMDRISGADQSMQGSLRQSGPERLTGAEFQGTRASATSRLQRIAMIIGMQFAQDIGTMFAVHTQQYMSKDQFIKVTGRSEQALRSVFGPDAKNGKVSPYDISVNYDLVVRDGSIPGGNFSDAWIQLFKVIGGDQQLRQEFDITRIFMYIAQQLGAKNVEDFKNNMGRIQTQTMPDETVNTEAQKGNLVPVSEV